MPYTSQGHMNPDDLAQHQADTDAGGCTISIDDPPEWLDMQADCPVCSTPVGLHDAVNVVAASGEIYGCLRHESQWQYPPIDVTERRLP